jgi:hypothetical protein
MSRVDEIIEPKKGGVNFAEEQKKKAEEAKAKILAAEKTMMRTEDQQQAEQSAFLQLPQLEGPESKFVPEKTPQTTSSGIDKADVNPEKKVVPPKSTQEKQSGVD